MFAPPTFSPSAACSEVRVVTCFDELISATFGGGVNAICWPRALSGDFAEVLTQLKPGQGITTLEEEQLLALPLSAAGRMAVEVMLQDQRLLREHGLDPVLDCVNGYLPVEDSGPLRTDVCSFHADSATVPADTWLCTYHGASSEILRHAEAIRRVDMPATRAELLRHYGGADDAGFAEYLNDHYFDLHYAPLPSAKLFSLGVGNLWRIALEYPGCPVPPCIHRAPDPVPGQPRLLLIS